MINHKHTGAIAGLMAILMMVSLTGCASLDLMMSDIKGSLIGNAFNVKVYDNYGNNVINVHGKRVDVAAESTDENGNADSSVINITADGQQMKQVGNTVIFTEDGLNPVKDYSLPKDVNNAGDGSITLFDRNVNELKNSIGTAKTIVISSQLGIPIAVYAGDSVGVSVPDDLPKMTKLTIDGKALYVHRANYVIMDTDAL